MEVALGDATGDTIPAAIRRLLPTLKIRVLCCCHARNLWIFFVMYDFPRAGSPTMMMTSFAPTSRSAIRPSGDTRDRVMPGMLSVVAWGRIRGVWLPEFCRTGGLRDGQHATYGSMWSRAGSSQRGTYSLGDPGAVDARLRLVGLSTVTEPSLEPVALPFSVSSRICRRALAREPPMATWGGRRRSCEEGTWDNGRSPFWDKAGDAVPAVVDCVDTVCVRVGSWLLIATFASIECFRPKSA